MNATKQLLARQEWIGQIKKNKMAVAAINTYAAAYVPRHIKSEIRTSAAVAGVPYFDVLCSNLAYEIAMISCSLDEGLASDFWKGLAGLKATRFGCTSFGIWEMVDGPFMNDCQMTQQVLHARNLDWDDPDGLLAKHTKVVKMPTRFPKIRFLASTFGETRGFLEHFYSVTFPGYSGILTGVAPGRFSVALNAVWNDDGVGLGAAPTLLLRQALETCADYYDAIKLLSRTRLVCGAMFTVVDGRPMVGGPSPRAVVIERTTGKYAIRKPVQVQENVFVVCATNNFQIIGKEPIKGGGSDIGETSCQRHKTVMEEAAKLREDFGMEDVRAILDKVRLSCTIHSMVVDPVFDALDVRR